VISANFSPKNPNLTPTQDWSAYSRAGEETSGYDKCYSLKIMTPFGKEDATLGVKGNVAELFNTSGKYFIDSFTETDTSFETSFAVDTPIVTDIHINLSIEPGTGMVAGNASIGEFAKYEITGVLL
jgi:hypothetical protein